MLLTAKVYCQLITATKDNNRTNLIKTCFNIYNDTKALMFICEWQSELDFPEPMQ